MALGERLHDGATLRDHLTAAAAHGAVDPRLAAHPPRGTSMLWQVFAELHASRPSGMGVSAIPPSEVAAWQQLHRVSLSPWEVETLAAVDRAVLSALNKQQQIKARSH